ncbi:unnamed protein product [Amoebophrya sp. A120]|nr:unnamed protein product [Amoebophrya sp. A120]|eukprot:GSA120T00021825001.1
MSALARVSVFCQSMRAARAVAGGVLRATHLLQRRRCPCSPSNRITDSRSAGAAEQPPTAARQESAAAPGSCSSCSAAGAPFALRGPGYARHTFAPPPPPPRRAALSRFA